MKNSIHQRLSRRVAFSLIELLVVIAVIGVLAALIFPITGALKKKRTINVAKTELAQVETAIDAYKAKYGTYPPDAATPLINQLYFELKGTIRTNGIYQTLDGSGQIPEAQCPANFGLKVTGFVNSSASAKGDDDKGAAVNFLANLKPNQSGPIDASNPALSLVKLLACSIKWEKASSAPVLASPELIPWQYVSTNPTNNPNSYDLWADVLIGGKTYHISNWSNQAQQ